MKTFIRGMAIGCVAVTLLTAAPRVIAMGRSAAIGAEAARFPNKDPMHVSLLRVGVVGLNPVIGHRLQTASEPCDGIMFVQESRMSRLHRQWGRFGQSRGTYFYNGGPSYYHGIAHYQNGSVFYAPGYDNAYAPDTTYMNNLHAAWETPMGSGRVFLRHEFGGLPQYRAADVDASRKEKRPNPATGVLQVPKDVQLNEQQQSRVEALEKEFSPRRAELQEKLVNVLTNEQRQAIAAAKTKAAENGKKGRAIREAARTSVDLTDEQKKQLMHLQREMGKLMQESRGILHELLTDAQRTKLKSSLNE